MKFRLNVILAILIAVMGFSTADAAKYAQTFETLLTSQRAGGATLAGGKAYFYVPGTTTLKAIYTNRNKTTPSANPITLSADGTAQIFGDGLYDVKLTNSALVQKAYWEDVKIQDVDIESTDFVSNYVSLSAAVSEIGTSKKTLVINQDCTVSANLIIPDTLNIEVLNGYKITVSSGVTLTMSPPIANLYQIFAGSGTFVINGVVLPEWWGAKADGITDSASAIQSACNASHAVEFSTGTYLIKPTLTQTYQFGIMLTSANDGLILRGRGKSTMLKANNNGSSTAMMMFGLTTAKNITFENIGFDGDASAAWTSDPATPVNGYHAIWFGPTADFEVANIKITGCYFTGTFDSAVQSYGSLSQTYPAGQDHHNASRYIRVSNCIFERVGSHGIGMNEWYDSSAVNNHFIDYGQRKLIMSGGYYYGSGLAVDVSGGCNRVLVSDNIAYGGLGGFKAEVHLITQPGHAYDGQYNYSRDVTFANNIITATTELPDGTGYAIKLNGVNHKALGNTIKKAFGQGIIDAAGTCENSIISGNSIESVVVTSGETSTPVPYGIRIAGTRHTVANNTITGVNGVYIGPGDPRNIVGFGIKDETRYTRIVGNFVYKNSMSTGIGLGGTTGTIIDGNTILDNGYDPTKTVLGGISLRAGSDIDLTEDAIITNNYIGNTYGNFIDGTQIYTTYGIYAEMHEVYNLTEHNNKYVNLYGDPLYTLANPAPTVPITTGLKNKIVRTNGVPTVGTYTIGDRWIHTAPTAGGVAGGVCVTSGTILATQAVAAAGAATATGTVTSGSRIVTVTATYAELQRIVTGMYISIAGAFSSAKIRSISNYDITDTNNSTATLYMDSAATGSVTDVAITQPAFVFKNESAIGS